MWAFLVFLLIAGTVFSFLRFRKSEFRQLPSSILGKWQGREAKQIYAFYPNGTCKASAVTPDSQYALIDGGYRLDKDILTISFENQVIISTKAFVNGDMLVLTSLEDKQKLIFNRF